MKKGDLNIQYSKTSKNTFNKCISSNINLKYSHTFQNILLNNRQNTNFHHNNELIQIIYNNIKNGDIEALSENVLKPINGDIGNLSKTNTLRSFKNFLICTVALYSKAAIEGGLPSEDAYSLSDSFIQTIEEINSNIILDELWYKIVFEFAIRVNSILELKYSRLVFICIYLINKYLYTDISLSFLANTLNITPQYLSSLFKKEVGLSISNYIFTKKIDEAKYLLSYTNKSILDISTLLCFHDQSYFTRIFKRYIGTTPKKYRNEHILNI